MNMLPINPDSEWQQHLCKALPQWLWQAEMWDAFAHHYDGYSRLAEPFVAAQIQAMALQPHETLLDVGAGTGRLSIPAARLAHRVTALDISASMLEHLRRNAAAAGVNNVDAVQQDWQTLQPDDFAAHDVVLLSRSPAMGDLAKANAIARRAVYVMFYSGQSLKRFHDTLVAGIESPPPTVVDDHKTLPMQALIFNRLTEMGIDARVDYLDDGFDRWYPDMAAAVADFAWLQLPSNSEPQLRRNLAPWLQPDGDGVRLHMRTSTAVIWWHK